MSNSKESQDHDKFNFTMQITRDLINPSQPVMHMTFGNDQQLDAFMRTLCDMGILTKIEKIQTN